MKKLLCLPDLHAPYHSEKAYALFLKVAKSFKPDILVVMGDFADFHAVSSHVKDPEKLPFSNELAEVNKQLDRLNGLAKRNIFLQGNHCSRLERFVLNKAPELYGVLNTRSVLGLDQRGFEYYPHQTPVQIGKLYLVHDIGYSGKNALRQTLGDFQGNVVTAHTHRLGSVVEGNLRGETHISCGIGWLGDPEQIDYEARPKVKRDWQHGFGYGYIMPDRNVHFQSVPIVRNKAFVSGKLIKL